MNIQNMAKRKEGKEEGRKEEERREGRKEKKERKEGVTLISSLLCVEISELTQ